jgi:hypothetical protein
MLDPDGGPTVATPAFLLPGLIDHQHRARIGQVLDHEAAHHPHGLLVVPHRVVA